jgi:hypothetical protein
MIVRLYETFEDDKNLYLVQEYSSPYAAFVRAASFSRDSSSMAISMKKMPVRYSHRSSNAYDICTPKRSPIET